AAMGGSSVDLAPLAVWIGIAAGAVTLIPLFLMLWFLIIWQNIRHEMRRIADAAEQMPDMQGEVNLQARIDSLMDLILRQQIHQEELHKAKPEDTPTKEKLPMQISFPME